MYLTRQIALDSLIFFSHNIIRINGATEQAATTIVLTSLHSILIAASTAVRFMLCCLSTIDEKIISHYTITIAKYTPWSCCYTVLQELLLATFFIIILFLKIVNVNESNKKQKKTLIVQTKKERKKQLSMTDSSLSEGKVYDGV